MSKASKYAEQVRSGAVLSLPNLATFIEEQQARLDAAEQVVEAVRSYRLRRSSLAMAELVEALRVFDGLARSGAKKECKEVDPRHDPTGLPTDECEHGIPLARECHKCPCPLTTAHAA